MATLNNLRHFHMYSGNSVKHKRTNMRTSLRSVFIACIALEILALGIVVYKLYVSMHTPRRSGVGPVVVLNSHYLSASPSAALRYYYEYKPDTVEYDSPSWLSYTAIHTYNHDGLNDRYDYAVTKPADTFRIVALGDSFTYGEHVNTADSWPEKLEDRLGSSCTAKKHYEVINLGVAGYDVQYIAHRYEVRGVKYHPDLIIWFESGSGFDRLSEISAQYTKLLSAQPGSSSSETTIKRSDGRITNVMYDRVMAEVHARYSDQLISDMVEASWQEFFRARDSTKTVIAMFGVEPVVNKLKLAYWARDQKNVWVDPAITDIYDTPGMSLPDFHPSAIGHDRIASDLLTYILANKLVPCK